MKRFIVLGLMLALLSGCATVGVVSKPPGVVTVDEKTDMVWEWWGIFGIISDIILMKGL